jgi:polyribonucleotide nucleotidyltransferase
MLKDWLYGCLIYPRLDDRNEQQKFPQGFGRSVHLPVYVVRADFD